MLRRIADTSVVAYRPRVTSDGDRQPAPTCPAWCIGDHSGNGWHESYSTEPLAMTLHDGSTIDLGDVLKLALFALASPGATHVAGVFVGTGNHARAVLNPHAARALARRLHHHANQLTRLADEAAALRRQTCESNATAPACPTTARALNYH
jgi:hypothetical protein